MFLETKKAQEYYPGKHFSSCLSEIKSYVTHLEHKIIHRYMHIFFKGVLAIEKEIVISEKRICLRAPILSNQRGNVLICYFSHFHKRIC